MKFNEYWCNNDLFCNVKDNILNVTQNFTQIKIIVFIPCTD
jgi:hypothetical protein